jgi:hypothetical protein
MKDLIYITGHKNPDTDSICAAIAYAEFKNKMGIPQAVPVRLGEVNRETQFILDYFGVEVPKLIETVKVQVSDLHIDNVAPVSPDISLKMAWNIMKKNNSKTLPVVDENDSLIGIATITNLFSSFMDIWDNDILFKSNTKLENIVDTLSANYIYVHDEHLKLAGKIVTAAMAPDSTEHILEKGDVVICGDREDTQRVVINKGASLMIITGNHTTTEEIIELAKTCKPPVEIEKGEIIGGFAHNQVLALAGPVVEAVKSGAIKKFFVMAGCDGRQKSRNYYTEFAQALPKDTVILTAGCAKYKYNKLDLGDINGIPRVLDAGQCNDSYSLALIALKLKEVFELQDINELPIAFNIAWYEQKAVIVLLALLYLGVKNIHLGPTLPAFLSPNVAKVLVIQIDGRIPTAFVYVQSNIHCFVFKTCCNFSHGV